MYCINKFGHLMLIARKSKEKEETDKELKKKPQKNVK